MRRILAATLLALSAPLALPAAGQALRSGPNAPSVSGQLPPGTTADVPRSGADNGNQPVESRGARQDDPASRARPGNPSVNAPAVPGARQPQHSTGVTGGRHDMPENPGARPDASTTGR